MRNFSLVFIPFLVLGLAACAGGPNTKSRSNGAAGMEQGSGAGGYGEGSGGYSEKKLGQNSGQSESNNASPFHNPSNPLSKKRIYFEFDSSTIEQQYKSILKAHAKYLVDHPRARVRLAGNTDERGTREYNIGLGQRRAKAVAQFLELQGVGANQITTISYGEEKPLTTGHNKEAWKKNRRVDIIYTNRGS